MRVLMFQERFADKVAKRIKRQTVRKEARCKPGDTLSLRKWTGKPYRSKQKLLRTELCKVVIPVRITQAGILHRRSGDWFCHEAFARADGFENWQDMREWFEATHGLPFDGYVIMW